MSKEIPFEDTEEATRKALDKRKVRVADKKDKKKKAKRGRPKGVKGKPKWDKKKYSKNAVAQMINNFVFTGANKTFMRENPYLPEDIDKIALGERVAFICEYYLPDLPLDHPGVVMLEGFGLLAIVTARKREKKRVTVRVEKGK